MSVIRVVLHNNLIPFGSPASTVSRPTAVALTVDMCEVRCHVARQRGTSGKQVERDGRLEAVAGQESRAAGDTVVQPEGAAELRKASGVAGTCSGTAEDIVVWQMPRGMPSGPGETLWNVAGWQWKSWQPGDAVRRQAEDGTMVGGSAEDESRGRRHIGRWKAHLEQRQSPRWKAVA